MLNHFPSVKLINSFVLILIPNFFLDGVVLNKSAKIKIMLIVVILISLITLGSSIEPELELRELFYTSHAQIVLDQYSIDTPDPSKQCNSIVFVNCQSENK